MEADITGLMVQPVDNWEERAKRLCKPDNFTVYIAIEDELGEELSDDEWHRLDAKLNLVREFARYMAAGMLKGTLKYSTDTYSLEQWCAHLAGEGADQANYQMLLINKWREENSSE